ncbi:MAG: hypothetical protein AB7O74_04995 [Candidatus Nanopelagicales bacterium]
MTDPSPASTPEGTSHGPGRLLIAVYAVLAIGATVRSLYELATKFSAAPVSYSLSLFAAVVYVVITVCLIRGTPRARTIAQTGMWIELVGVLVVGTLSIVNKELFTNPETGKAVSSVWYWYGRDYLFIPLVLPVLGLLFIRRQKH